MAYETILYEVSDNRIIIPLNRSDRLGTDRELVEALVPLLVDEFVGHCRTAGDAPHNKVTCAAGSAP